jgi:hypothetical protein
MVDDINIKQVIGYSHVQTMADNGWPKVVLEWTKPGNMMREDHELDG